MAFCTRCGQQTEDAEEFCSGCGSFTGWDPADRPRTVQAMAAGSDYLRPFAPEGTQPAALRSADDAVLWNAPAVPGEPEAWQFPSPSGQLPDFTPPPRGLPDTAGGTFDPFGPAAQPYPSDTAGQPYPFEAPGQPHPFDTAGQPYPFEAAEQPYPQAPGDDHSYYGPDQLSGPRPVQLPMPPRTVGELRATGRPPMSQARPADRSHNGRWLAVAAALVVILLCAIAAAVVLGHHGRQPPASDGARRPASSAAGPTAAVAGSGALSLAPGVPAAPHAVAVERFVIRYFRAINDHDYAAYRMLFSTSLRNGLSAAAFNSGYGSSRDSQATLRSVSSAAGGELDAVVTFTSHQNPAASPTHSSCTAWTISLYLVRQGSGYVLVSPPAGYQATFSSC
ncbi:MAG TPA: hypothetical protein VEL03_20340 [Streptosporangiaceae bacterium]|nr:hypothetical protein [Streptosporangiaceae bacterium]